MARVGLNGRKGVNAWRGCMGLFCENVRGRQNDYAGDRVEKWAGVKEWEGIAATCGNRGKGEGIAGKVIEKPMKGKRITC